MASFERHTLGWTLAVVTACFFQFQSANGSMPGCWTWEAGHSTIQTNTSSTSTPNPRCCAQTWTTADGLTYLFGGASAEFLSDFWKFDTKSKEWTYISGSIAGNSAGNKTFPGARNYSPTWTSPGKLWMWSGIGARFDNDDKGGFLTDLWSYDIESNHWTNETVEGVSPPPRNWANFWSLDNGDVFVHGGTGEVPHDFHDFFEWPLSDLWKFDIATKTWTAIYTQRKNVCADYDGDADGKRYPGSRSNSYTTVFNNKLYLYGGEGCIGTFPKLKTLKFGDFQDVWEFSPTNNTWLQIAGPQTVNGVATYGSLGVPSNHNLAPAEHAGYVAHTSLDGSLWFLAGEDGREIEGVRNDLWSFNISEATWTWQAGANHYNGTASYGQKGQTKQNNTPGARYAGQLWVEPSTNALWMFGGYGFDANATAGYLDDVWRFDVECDV